jgi:hypothetical protein
VSSVFCRRCAAPLPEGGHCPYCGAANPGGHAYTAAGVLTASTLFATLVVGAYAWLLSLVWGRWVGKFNRLPEGDPLHGRGVELAVGIGAALFCVVWFTLAYWLAPPARDAGRHRRRPHR